MSCATCKHSIQEAVKESDRVWKVVLICCSDIDRIRVVAADETCPEYEREPGACDEMGRGDSGNWN